MTTTLLLESSAIVMNAKIGLRSTSGSFQPLHNHDQVTKANEDSFEVYCESTIGFSVCIWSWPQVVSGLVFITGKSFTGNYR
jgi:hypothetical protein